MLSKLRIGSTVGPQIPDEIATSSVHPDDVLDEASWSEVSINGAQLTGAKAHGLVVAQSRLTKVNLAESRLAQLHATDVAFSDCNLSNMKATDSSFRRIVLSRSKLTGIQVSKTKFIDVEFQDCRMELAMFDEVKFKHVTFRGCQMREADFSETMFDQVRFVDCDLSRSMLARARTQRSEMRHCKLAGLRGLAQLRGIAMEWTDILENAEVFAAVLGIRIVTGSEESGE